jgi:hypothetical protein
MIERRSLTTDYFHLMTRSARASTLGGIHMMKEEIDYEEFLRRGSNAQ